MECEVVVVREIWCLMWNVNWLREGGVGFFMECEVV